MKLVALALAIAALPTSSALACSINPCGPHTLFPGPGSLPANMLRLLFTPGKGPYYPLPDAGQVEPRLSRLEGNTKVDVPFRSTPAGGDSVWIEPSEPITAGTTLVLDADPSACPAFATNAFTATYAVGERQPLPTALGSLGVTYSRGILKFSTVGSTSDCNSFSWADASIADLRIELAPDAQPFARLFAYQLYVDGQPRERFRTTPIVPDYRPHGEERVIATCANEAGSPPSFTGKHTVRFEGTLPDGTKLSTPELEIDLKCDGPAPTRPDAGVPWMADASVSDVESPTNDDGCSLASSRSGASGLLLTLALLLRRRRSG